MIAYRIYSKVNCADTWYDPDDIHITELGYKQSLEDALELVQKRISSHFFRKDAKISKRNDGSFEAVDFCSYGATVIIEPITLE